MMNICRYLIGDLGHGKRSAGSGGADECLHAQSARLLKALTDFSPSATSSSDLLTNLRSSVEKSLQASSTPLHTEVPYDAAEPVSGPMAPILNAEPSSAAAVEPPSDSLPEQPAGFYSPQTCYARDNASAIHYRVE